MSINKIIFNNLWLKILALMLAIATWFYVFDVVNTDSHLKKLETDEEIFSRYTFSVKEVPVKPVFTGKTPEGYRVIFENLKIDPPTIHVFGPEKVLDDVEELKTERINLGEYTRSVHLQLGIVSEVKFLQFDEKLIDVYIPVETIVVDKK